MDHSKFGICDISCLPMRKEASHRSEQVSEILFGESFEILNATSEWHHIRCSYDGYEGWIPSGTFQPYSQTSFHKDLTRSFSSSYDLVQPASSKTRTLPLLIGSTLPDFDGMVFKLGKEKFTVNGRVTRSGKKPDMAFLEKTAMQFLNAPYRWGGRSPFGIDCSGFTQVVFKLMNIRLLRDASQQITQGKEIKLLRNCRPGDLAFFGEGSSITHVGFILAPDRIIHASGRVKIDKLDTVGIYLSETRTYSHKLQAIRRIIRY